MVGRWTSPTSDLVAQSRGAYDKGDWDQAASLARRQLQRNGNDSEALRILARALIRLGRDEAATAIYKDRLGVERMQPEDHFLVGLTMVRLGRNETALKIWEKAASEGPEHPELLGSLAQQALALGRLDLADSAARGLARQPGWEARGLLLLGEIQHLLDNSQGAADALDQGLRLDPGARGVPLDPSHYRLLLARSWLQLGRPVEAQEQLMTVLASAKAAGSNPDREAHWLLSRAYLHAGQLKDASSALARASGYGSEDRLVPEPSPYLGSARCAFCHPDITRTYQRTRHARSFHHGPELLKLPLPDRPLAAPDDPKVTLSFRRVGQQVRVETREADRVINTLVDYAFGTRERYLTMIGRDDEGNYRGVRLSYYHTTSDSGWDRTAGDAGAPDGNDNVRGRPIDVRGGVVRCLHCHVTRPSAFREPPPEAVGPEAADSAIGCERCHGPGSSHAAAIAADFPDRAIAIVRARTAPAAVVNDQCTECHTVDIRSAIMSAPDDPHYVRSPGMTLTFSRCYTQSDRGLSCLTCHDPHREVESSASFYETKCLTCHSQQKALQDPPGSTTGISTTARTGRRTACPVNPLQDCLKCHMPEIPVAELHTSLTDHYIRVHTDKTSEAQPGPAK
jgi:tetratricopeptide (TPR) repeat protein